MHDRLVFSDPFLLVKLLQQELYDMTGTYRM